MADIINKNPCEIQIRLAHILASIHTDLWLGSLVTARDPASFRDAGVLPYR